MSSAEEGRSIPGDSEPVPVVITSEDGRTLSLDIPLTVPISKLSPAIEKHFKVAAGSQVLKYNGDPLQLTESLQSSGALLLPGEPYVRLSLLVARGNRVAVVLVLPNGKECPRSVHEETSFKDLKKELVKENPSLGSYKDIRLYFRYNELHDQADCRHWRIPNNAKIEVVRKPDFDLEGKRNKFTTKNGATSGSESAGGVSDGIAQFRIKKAKHQSAGIGQQPARGRAARPSSATAGSTSKRGYSSTGEESASSRDHTKRPLSTEGRRSAGSASARLEEERSKNVRKTTTTRTGSAYGQKSSTLKDTRATTSTSVRNGTTNNNSSKYSFKKVATNAVTSMSPSKLRGGQGAGTPSHHTTNNRPRAFYELEKEVENEHDEELEAERRRLQVMSEATANLRNGGAGAGRGAGGNSEMIIQLQKQVKEANARESEAMQRITELERTVQRYQSLIRRMTAACPADMFEHLTPMKNLAPQHQQQMMMGNPGAIPPF